MSVAYRERGFPAHSHAEYVIGAVTAGAETLSVGGRSSIVAAGGVLRLHPDETHANATVGPDLLRYEVLYLPGAALRPHLGGDDEPRMLDFAAPMVRDPALYRTVRAAHACLAGQTGALEQESALSALVDALAGDRSRTVRHPPTPPATVAAARAYIDAHFAEAFGLQTLSAVTGLSVFHLVRSFTKRFGLSPLAYRNQRRVVAARAMLLDGAAIAETALTVGYADQSHLSRNFQRIVGVPPGRYIRQ